MRAELANLNHCAVPFLSRAVVNLCWYGVTYILYSSTFLVLDVIKGGTMFYICILYMNVQGVYVWSVFCILVFVSQLW